MNIKTKKMICLLVGIASVLTIIGTVSYAYFSAVGKFNPQQYNLSTGTVRVTFSDNDTGIIGQLAFGESITKSFTIENTGTVDANVKIYWKDLINTYGIGSLTYTLLQSETSDGVYTEIVSKTNVPKSENPSTKELVNSLNIPVGATYYYKLVITLNYLSDVNQDADLNAKFSSSFSLEDIHYTNTIEKIIASSHGIRTDFDIPATTDEGIFEMEDDYGTSYYFRGAVENNYVKFGINAQGQEMWWRIIRINGDRTIRIIYNGTSGSKNGQMSSAFSSKFNTLDNDVKYLGWMYGGNKGEASTSREEAQKNETDSDMKIALDNWYKENIVNTHFESAIADNLFCNDRSTPGKEVSNWSSDTGLGYGTQKTGFGAMSRLMTNMENVRENAIPILKCPQKNDAFTVNDTTKGNGALTYPVGLITIDEILIAGSGLFNQINKQYFLYTGSSLSMSPYRYDNCARMFRTNTADVNNNDVDSLYSIFPVLNLKENYFNSLIGTGTLEDPYHSI